MAQQIKVIYKDSDKSVVDFINIEGGLDTTVVIEPTLSSNGMSVASEILSFADDINLTNDMVAVSSSGVATKV